MAARRLVVVMLVLLALSTLAAALLPTAAEREATTTEPRTRSARPPANPPSDLGLELAARMRLADADPKTVRIEEGDQLRLEVSAPFGADVEIPGLGLTGVATAAAPASFDILATQTGRFPVRAVDPPGLAGRLLVARPGTGRCGTSTPPIPQGRLSAPPCGPRDGRGSRGSGRSARRP